AALVPARRLPSFPTRRSSDLAIDEGLAAARLGKSSRLVIRGEPGIGKTALLEYAAQQAGSMRLLAARGVEFEADVPFAGLSELRSEEHTSELQSRFDLVCRLL